MQWAGHYHSFEVWSIDWPRWPVQYRTPPSSSAPRRTDHATTRADLRRTASETWRSGSNTDDCWSTGRTSVRWPPYRTCHSRRGGLTDRRHVGETDWRRCDLLLETTRYLHWRYQPHHPTHDMNADVVWTPAKHSFWCQYLCVRLQKAQLSLTKREMLAPAFRIHTITQLRKTTKPCVK